MFGLRRRPGPLADARDVPIGMFAGQPPLPMTPRRLLTDQLLNLDTGSLAGPPGVRLSESTNRAGRYWGASAVPAPIYPGGKAKANRPEQLEVAPYTAMRPKGL